MFKQLTSVVGLAITATLVACGGGGDSGTSQPTSSQLPTQTTPAPVVVVPPTNPVVIVATQTVVDYINVRHTLVATDFATSEKALNASQAAQGLLQSGSTFTKSGINYNAVIDGFLNDVLKFVQKNVQTTVVDKPTITALLRNYQTTDANFVYSYYGGQVLSASALQTFKDGVANNVNTSYNLTVLQLP